MIASGIDILQIFKRIFHSVPKFFAIVDFIKCTVRRNFLQFQEYGPFQIRETMSIKLKCIQGGASSEDNLVSQVSQKFQFVSGLVCDIDWFDVSHHEEYFEVDGGQIERGDSYNL